MELRVVTWNLQGRPPAAAGITRVLDAWHPDLLLLQEASSTEIEREPTLATYPHRVLRPDAGYPPGMAILSRLPIRASGELAPRRPRESQPRLIWATLAADDGAGEVLAASFHAAAPIGDPRSDHPWARSIHLRAFAEFAAGLAASEVPAVIGGDANTIRYVVEPYRDATHALKRAARTWRPVGGMTWLPAVARLDRILVSPGWDLLEADTGCGMSRSDHCPVFARVRLGHGRPGTLAGGGEPAPPDA